MKVAVIIPARYASTRLPGKPLALLAGRPMIEHVYRRVQRARGIDAVYVATDDARVADAVVAFGGEVVMTSPTHATGTDRIAEVASTLHDVDVVINVQGDEPLIDPQVIENVASYLTTHPEAVMATVAAPLAEEEADNPSVVKVVTTLTGTALYFSRSRIPYPRQGGQAAWKHIGMYGYRRTFLFQYASLAPTPLEQSESLEQLRALEHGYPIHVITTEQAFHGVDTPEDLARVQSLIEKEASYANSTDW